MPVRTFPRFSRWDAGRRRRFSMVFWPAWGIAIGITAGAWNPLAGLVLAALGILAGVAAWRVW